MKLLTFWRSVALSLALLVSGLAWTGDITWVDVRTSEEFNQQHVPDALNIPVEEIDVGIVDLGLDKDAVIYLYCRSGRRAGVAKESLEALGYTDVVNIGGLEAALAKAQEPPTN